MKYLVLLVVLVGCATIPPAPDIIGVTRDLPDSVMRGEQFTVTLDIQLGPHETFYILEEEVPESIVVEAETDSKNRIKLVDLEAPKKVTYTYKATAPDTPGPLTFKGRYAFNSMEEPVQILGDKTIIIR